MPTFLQKGDDGKSRIVRPPYRAEDYTLPAGWIDKLRADYATTNPEELLSQPGSVFNGLSQMGRIERSGKQYMLLKSTGKREWVVEVELTGESRLGELNAVAPEEAWKLATKNDAAHNVTIAPMDPAKL
jgi:hypothetical protein